MPINPDREAALFSEAADISDKEQRDRFLRSTCQGDPALLDRLRKLFHAAEVSGEDFFPEDEHDTSWPAFEFVGERPGDLIGPYKLLEKIGEGGFGVVFMAEQEAPIRRRVALKVIKAGMDTNEVIGRFEAERQALAMMDHPNIAKVLDAGATTNGRPYFVMELVRGIPITEYCDGNQVSLRERLKLFIPVCQAVQSAHQKGIIHRDLKPGNILVTLYHNEPMVKVIDFGIAKATQRRLTERTLFTRFNQMIGTPAYMSPEQAASSETGVDTRSDIYSLGVVLYELLTGSPPISAERLKGLSYTEVMRMVAEFEPLKPSTLLDTLGESDRLGVSRRRQTDPRWIGFMMRQDLDWIILKALDKDPSRRYESAHSLAADLQRHLNGEPVSAVAPSLGYQARKFFRKHRQAVITASCFLLVLVGATCVATWQALYAMRGWNTAEEQRARADHEAEKAKAVNEFLTQDILGRGKVLDPTVEITPDKPLREVILDAAERVDGRFAGQPLAEASVRQTLGISLWMLGEHGEAIPQLRRALDLFRQDSESNAYEVLVTMRELGNCLVNYSFPSRSAEGEKYLVDARRELLDRFGAG